MTSGWVETLFLSLAGFVIGWLIWTLWSFFRLWWRERGR